MNWRNLSRTALFLRDQTATPFSLFLKTAFCLREDEGEGGGSAKKEAKVKVQVFHLAIASDLSLSLSKEGAWQSSSFGY